MKNTDRRRFIKNSASLIGGLIFSGPVLTMAHNQITTRQTSPPTNQPDPNANLRSDENSRRSPQNEQKNPTLINRPGYYGYSLYGGYYSGYAGSYYGTGFYNQWYFGRKYGVR